MLLATGAAALGLVVNAQATAPHLITTSMADGQQIGGAPHCQVVGTHAVCNPG
jgi:hypothetical protein